MIEKSRKLLDKNIGKKIIPGTVISVNEIDTLSILFANGTVNKVKINASQKDGNTVLLVPKIDSTISVLKDKKNGEYIIADAGENCDEYNVTGVDESTGEYFVISKEEISDTVVDLNIE
jgi:hypothetical protein